MKKRNKIILTVGILSLFLAVGLIVGSGDMTAMPFGDPPFPRPW